MLRFSGIGMCILGTSPPDEQGFQTGTQWFTFLWLPIIPFSRHRFKYGESYNLPFHGSGQEAFLFSEEPLIPREIIMTYLLFWLVYLPLSVGPVLIYIPTAAAIPNRTDQFDTAFQVIYLGWMGLFLFVIEPKLSAKLIPVPPAARPPVK